jgi:hypothetical protein
VAAGLLLLVAVFPLWAAILDTGNHSFSLPLSLGEEEVAGSPYQEGLTDNAVKNLLYVEPVPKVNNNFSEAWEHQSEDVYY